jgi:hypothetical protein
MKRMTKLLVMGACMAFVSAMLANAMTIIVTESPGAASMNICNQVATVEVGNEEAALIANIPATAPNMDDLKNAATATVSPAGIANPNKTMNVKNATATANTIAAANANLGAPRKVCSNRNTHFAAQATTVPHWT